MPTVRENHQQDHLTIIIRKPLLSSASFFLYLIPYTFMPLPVPKDTRLDSTLNLLKDGYTFIEKRCREYHTDIFETRILGEKAVCIHGHEAAAIFYDQKRFQRKGATPKRIKETLFGKKGVQSLDDEDHQHRKQSFMSLMSRDAIERFMQLSAEQWHLHLLKWEQSGQINLFDESTRILSRAACHWAGVPLREDEVDKRTQDLVSMIDAFGGVALRHLRGKQARQRTEKWIATLVEQVRQQKLPARQGTALYEFAMHRDLHGQWLDAQVAAVEIINIIRPLTAIAWFHTYLALALYQYPNYREKLQQGSDQDLNNFVQEVRRYFPFTPFLGARVRRNFEWRGYQFREGTLVLLDVYGTNRDLKQWERPEVFWPERFNQVNSYQFGFIPQGGGDFAHNHRCAGEWVTISAMKVALDYLVNHMEYEVPEQDLSYDLSRMPTRPADGFILQNVKMKTPPTSQQTAAREERPITNNQANVDIDSFAEK